MPLFLVILGFGLIMIAWQNNEIAIASQIGQDFSNGLLPFFGACIAIGSLGFVPQLRGFSRALIGLLLLVYVLADRGGLFTQLQNVLNGGITAAGATPGPSSNVASAASPGNVISGGGAPIIDPPQPVQVVVEG